MTQLHPAADAYLQAVRQLLDAPGKDRERLLARLSHAVSAFAEENPGAAAEELSSVFGTPERCAAELLTECDPAEVTAVRRRKRRRLVAVIAILAALLIAMVIFWFCTESSQVKYVDTYITEDIPDLGGFNP